MRSRIIFATFAMALGLSGVAYAEELTQFWNFRGQVPVNTGSDSLTKVEQLDEGLYIQTDTDGFLLWPDSPIKHPTDVMTLRTRSASNIQAFLAWKPMDGNDGMYRVPFLIPAGDIAQNIDVVVNDHPEWNWQTNALGVQLPAGAELVIEEVSFRHWSFFERNMERWKSFWTFDDFRAYSINFLWGPLLASNEPARTALFEMLPPPAVSAMRVVYGLIVLAAIIGIGIRFFKKDTHLATGIVWGTIAVMWIVLDFRMGAEIMSYTYDDMRTYVMSDDEDQTLRTHGKLYGTINKMLPMIQEESRFALIAPQQSVYYPNLRYMAYPSVAVLEGQDREGVKLWAMFDSPNVRVDEQGRLWRPGSPTHFEDGREILSASGKIILRIDDGTFLFSTDK